MIISRGSTPVVRLVPVKKQPFRIGLLTGQAGTGPDYLTPMDRDELDLWEGSGR